MSIEKKSSNPAVSKDNTIEGTKIPLGVKMSQNTVDQLVTVIDLTPELARIYLDSQTKNRNVNRNNIEYLSNELKIGKWDLTGEAIKFDFDGHMRDGQHRCVSVFNTGVSCKMMVVGGLSPETIDIMDTGKARTIADILEIDGHRDATTVSAVIQILMNLENGGYDKDTKTPKGYPDNRSARFYAEEHREKLSDKVKFALDWIKSSLRPASLYQSVFVSLYIHLSDVDPDNAELFFEGLIDPDKEEKPPMFILWQWMDYCKDKSKLAYQASTIDIIHGYIHAYNCFVENKKCKESDLRKKANRIKFIRPAKTLI